MSLSGRLGRTSFLSAAAELSYDCACSAVSVYSPVLPATTKQIAQSEEQGQSAGERKKKLDKILLQEETLALNQESAAVSGCWGLWQVIQASLCREFFSGS